jgi:prepilin-type N-terminal cleavage/methylation domain-containing protein
MLKDIFIRFNKKNKKAGRIVADNEGFTLIELMTTVSIIVLLASLTMVALNSVRKKASIVKTQTDLAILQKAINMLEMDTALSPNKLEFLPCVQDPEVYLNDCAAGVQCNDGGFTEWRGPYINIVPEDAWNTFYYFDPDYICTDQIGCENVISGTWVRAIVSFGPDKAEDYGPGSDDVVLVLCQ